jgi:hypothetical protein
MGYLAGSQPNGPCVKIWDTGDGVSFPAITDSLKSSICAACSASYHGGSERLDLTFPAQLRAQGSRSFVVNYTSCRYAYDCRRCRGNY